MPKKITAIIQARLTSTRLSGKVLMEIENRPMLWHILNRLKFSKKINDFILAIPDTKENDTLEKFAKENKIKYFRGNEENLLWRYYETAKKFKCEIIVRIWADNPLIDHQIIDLTIEKHLNLKADYTSNNLKRTFPLGLDVEVFNFKVLEKTYQEVKNDSERENPTLYIGNHPEIFHLVNVENDKDFSYLRWTVDEAEDLEFVREVYKRLYKKGKIFLMEEILKLLKNHPEILEINKNIKQRKA